MIDPGGATAAVPGWHAYPPGRCASQGYKENKHAKEMQVWWGVLPGLGNKPGVRRQVQQVQRQACSTQKKGETAMGLKFLLTKPPKRAFNMICNDMYKRFGAAAKNLEPLCKSEADKNLLVAQMHELRGEMRKLLNEARRNDG